MWEVRKNWTNTIIGNELILVSYTHLDVYKRQVYKEEKKYLKELKDPKIDIPKIKNPKSDNNQVQTTKPKTQQSNPAPQTIMDFYNQEFKGLWKGPLRLTREREQKIKARLKSFTIEELKTAITNLRQSTFHCGNNDKERVYGTPEYLLSLIHISLWSRDILV